MHYAGTLYSIPSNKLSEYKQFQESSSLHIIILKVAGGSDPQNWVLGFLDTRQQELPAGSYRIKNIVRSYDLSKLGLRLYLQYACEFQSRLLKNELQI